MDFSKIERTNEGIIVKNIQNFEPKHVFECGQCFRWEPQPGGSYIGIAFNRVLEIEKKDDNLILYNATEEDFQNIWTSYFDLYRNYEVVKSELSKDLLLKKAVDFGHGIRLLKQEPFEILISFIISTTKKIPLIKRSIHLISERWGTLIEYKGKKYHAFPDLNQLKAASIEELKNCGVGYRAEYIFHTVNVLAERKLDLDYIGSLEAQQCYEWLQKFYGVGPKVADCIMLFSMQKYAAFPVDVWVKRAMQHFYMAPEVSLKGIREFGMAKFGIIAGFAQQYLFYYARENQIIGQKST